MTVHTYPQPDDNGPGRHFHPERQVTVTIRAAGNRTVQVWGRITGFEHDTATGVVTGLEITRAHVYDGGLRNVQNELREAWSNSKHIEATDAYGVALTQLAQLQREDRGTLTAAAMNVVDPLLDDGDAPTVIDSTTEGGNCDHLQ